MKKITINKIDEDIYYDVLDNGLTVYFYINNNIHNNYVTFTTKYGSIYNTIVDTNGKKIKIPNGVAHFLEHKVFVQENDPQPEDFYGKSGALCNAYTTFKNTTYMFNGTDNVYENTEYLLDFVQSIHLTKENVENEKGIIIQEINMCDDRPGDILYDKVRLNAIKVSPFRESIIGTAKEVKSITKELLEDCYKRFYHPSNMFLVVAGNFDKEKMLKIIKDNQAKKHFEEFELEELDKCDEPDEVTKKKEIIKCNTNIPKVAYSIKIPTSKFKTERRRLNIYMYLIFNILFGDTSSFDEKAKNEGIITGTLYYNSLNIDSHFIVSLISSSDRYDDLIKMIKERLADIKIDKNEFERKKKVLLSNEIFGYENVENVNDMIVDNIIFDNRIEENIIDLIRSLTIKELMDIVKKINFDNTSIVILKK